MPVLIFAYCYGHIFYTIRRRSKVVASHVGRSQDVPVATTSRDVNTGQVQQQATAAAAKLSRTEMNVLKTMTAVIICFIVCWAPATFTSIVQLLTVWLFNISTLIVKSFPSHKAHRAALIFVSLTLSQTPVYTATPRTRG